MAQITQSNRKLGKAIQKNRQERGLTQEELAENVNISRAHMGHIEQGRKTPSIELLERISKVLRIRVKDIFPF